MTGREINSTESTVSTDAGIQLTISLSLCSTTGTSNIKKIIDITVRTSTTTVDLATGTPALRMNITCAIAPPLAPGVTSAKK